MSLLEEIQGNLDQANQLARYIFAISTFNVLAVLGLLFMRYAG